MTPSSPEAARGKRDLTKLTILGLITVLERTTNATETSHIINELEARKKTADPEQQESITFSLIIARNRHGDSLES